jgi:hypothetical protein
MSQFSLIWAPSSRKLIVIPVGSKEKLILVLQVFTLWAVLNEWIKLVNRGITVYEMILFVPLKNNQAIQVKVTYQEWM